RDLLPCGNARLLSHARVRAWSERLHEHVRRSEGHGYLIDPRQALGRRPRARGRNLAAVSSMSSRRPRADGALHLARSVKRVAVVAGVAAAALVLPAAAFAHAALLRTTPAASVTVNSPP